MFFNRLIIFTKRMCNKKLYIFLLIMLVALTIIYKMLPEQRKTADIKAAICTEEDSDYTDKLIERLYSKNSVYSFYVVSDRDMLIREVQSGSAECGFIIPDGFFNEYIYGIVTDKKIVRYTIPSSTLAPAITETLFNSIYRICAENILLFGADMHDYDSELSSNMQKYLESDEIFQLSDLKTGKFNFEEFVYHIDIPVFEIGLLLILFSGLLGLLIFMQDNESGIYIALSNPERFGIESASLWAALLPIFIVSCITSISIYGVTDKLIITLIFTLAVYAFSLLLGIITRKSTRLTKVLPLIMLISITIIFILSLT